MSLIIIKNEISIAATLISLREIKKRTRVIFPDEHAQCKIV